MKWGRTRKRGREYKNEWKQRGKLCVYGGVYVTVFVHLYICFCVLVVCVFFVQVCVYVWDSMNAHVTVCMFMWACVCMCNSAQILAGI